jgi:two-component system response regulator AtoC
MVIERILVVDNDPLVRNFLKEALQNKGMEVVLAESGKNALEILQQTSFDMVITDVHLADVSGIEILRSAKELSPHTLVVVITAFGTIESTVEVMRLGAFNYIIKPFSAEAIEAVLEKGREYISLVAENAYLRHQVSTGGSHALPQIIAESPAMKSILSDVCKIAASHASVLISGESGTGKEVIAHAIHYQSQRAHRPFIKVNCAAMPETLIESEFFGHEKGAFTGANLKRLGRFELANGGSLLLDEITEIPLALQAKLLRAVQEQEFERVGGTKQVRVDVRLISTSNQDVKKAVSQNILREDLYYRLNVIPIYLPPLRERQEDIVPLAEYFLHKMCLDNKKPEKYLTESAKQKLVDHSWLGNIRELANIIERAVVLNSSCKIEPKHLHTDE